MQMQMDSQGNKFVNDHFVYVASCDSLAAAASFTANISIEADSQFVAVKMSYMADLAGAPQTESTRVIPLIDVYITDSGSGRNLQNTGVPIANIAGEGGLPLVLPVPREFKPSSNISITFRNYSMATTYTNVKLSLIGYKRFKV